MRKPQPFAVIGGLCQLQALSIELMDNGYRTPLRSVANISDNTCAQHGRAVPFHIQPLHSALAQLTSLRKLCLAGLTCANAWAQVVSSLPAPEQLQQLILCKLLPRRCVHRCAHHCESDTLALQALAASLQPFGTLDVLHLDGRIADVSTTDDMASAIPHAMTRLHSLVLTGRYGRLDCNQGGSETDGAVMGQRLAQLAALSDLRLDCLRNSGTATVTRSLTALKHLRSLTIHTGSFASTKCSAIDLGNALTALTSLRRLNMSLPLAPAHHCPAATEVLMYQTGHLTALTCLDISGHELPDTSSSDDPHHPFTALQALRELNVSRMTFSSTATQTLARSVGRLTTLTWLNCSLNLD